MNGGLNCFGKVILSTLRLIWICQRQHIGILGGNPDSGEQKKQCWVYPLVSTATWALITRQLPQPPFCPFCFPLQPPKKFSFFRFSLHFIFTVYQSTFSDYVKINTSNNKQQEWNVPEEKGVVMEVRSAIRWLPLCGPESDWRCARKECLPAIYEETWVSILHPPPPARFLILPRCSTTLGMEMWSQFPL